MDSNFRLRAMQARLAAKIAGFAAFAVDYLRLPSVAIRAKAQSEISEPNPYRARTGSSNPSPSSGESTNHPFLGDGAASAVCHEPAPL
jgi:hypothetical protein